MTTYNSATWTARIRRARRDGASYWDLKLLRREREKVRLSAERERLLARLAEIDATLAERIP